MWCSPFITCQLDAENPGEALKLQGMMEPLDARSLGPWVTLWRTPVVHPTHLHHDCDMSKKKIAPDHVASVAASIPYPDSHPQFFQVAGKNDLDDIQIVVNFDWLYICFIGIRKKNTYIPKRNSLLLWFQSYYYLGQGLVLSCELIKEKYQATRTSMRRKWQKSQWWHTSAGLLHEVVVKLKRHIVWKVPLEAWHIVSMW